MQNLFRKLPRESKRIVKTEADIAGKRFFPFLLQRLDLAAKKLYALIQRRCKAIFLQADNLLDVIFLLNKCFKIACTTVDIDDCFHRTLKEFILDTEHTAMADGTAENAAEDVAASLV